MKIAVMILCFLMISPTMVFPEEVKIGVWIHIPHVYQRQNTNEVYGPGIDYIVRVVTGMGYTPLIHLLPLSRIIAQLRTGEIDLSLEFFKTPEREEFLWYPDMPAYIMAPALTFLASHPIEHIRSIEDLQGMRIGYLQDAVKGSFFDAALNVSFDLISGGGWVRQNLAKLLVGRIDAALDQNAHSYYAEAKNLGVAHLIKTIPLPGQGDNAYVVFSKRSPKGAVLLEKYNQFLKATPFYQMELIEAFLNPAP